MKLTYLGHATFLLESGSTRILIDPYNDKVGYPVPKVPATAVLVSHEHADHTNVAMATGSPRIIRGLAGGTWRTVKESVDGISISSVSAYHDNSKGKERGAITVFVLEGEGIRLVHLSDLGHQLDDAQVRAMGRPDVLMIPVGGHYTIDGTEAHAVASRLRPGIVIPMHYKTEVNPTSPISPIDAFLKSAKSVKHVGHTVTVEKSGVPPETQVWVMNWK